MGVSWELAFRPMVADDLRLLHDWLQRPHVQRWWRKRETYEEVVEHYLPAIEGSDPTDHYIALLGDRPIGMLQTYLVADYPKHATLMGVHGRGTAGIDILIGEEELTGQGIGTEVIRRFVAEVVFARPGTSSCVSDPAAENVASVRAFEKAGFRTVGGHVDPADGETHALVRIDRQGAQSAPR
ncbi:MAG: GNAT family N-acetyltransferase [Gaiellaceae bacterium]